MKIKLYLVVLVSHVSLILNPSVCFVPVISHVYLFFPNKLICVFLYPQFFFQTLKLNSYDERSYCCAYKKRLLTKYFFYKTLIEIVKMKLMNFSLLLGHAKSSRQFVDLLSVHSSLPKGP